MYLVLLAAGCESTSADVAGACDAGAGGGIEVSPGGPLALGFFEQQVFELALLGPNGAPLPGEPITVGLIGPAHNGSVSPFELTSDDEGEAQVTFTAPDSETQLEIRFSSPAVASDAVVEVTIDGAELGVTVNVGYDGNRELELLEASIYSDATCEELALDAEWEPIETQSADSIPAAFEFVDLLAGSVYTVSAVGLNGNHEARAEACADGLLPDGPEGSLILTDLPLDLVGVFDVTTVIETDGALTPVVDQLAASLLTFSSDVPDAILDAVREVIADEPLVAESFDQIRTDEDLDGALADDFAAREVDVAGALAAIWDDVNDGLAEIELAAELEIGAPNDGVHNVYHTIGLVAFDELDSDYLVSVPETGQTTAQAADDDVDLLVIDQHLVGLALGGPIDFLLESELALAYGSGELAQALESEVDCGAVVAVLAEPLSEVADAAEILSGCLNAMLGAQTLLDDEVALVDAEHAQVSFEEGSCRLSDPGQGSLVAALADGSFQVTWEGADPLGPMTAQFEGQLQD